MAVGDHYYCSKEVGASDSNSGLTPLLPWLTQVKATATTKLPDETVHFRCGDVWSEQGSIKGNGTLGRPVTYTSYGTGIRPIITAADITTGWALESSVAGGDRYKITTLGWSPTYCHREDGPIGAGAVTNLTKAASLVACTALNNWWYTGADLYVVVATGAVPNAGGITIWATRRNTCLYEEVSGEDYIVVSNIIFRFGNDGGGTYGCVHLKDNSTASNDWTFDNCLFEWGDIGINFGGQGTNSFAQVRKLTMRNCESRNNHGHGGQLIFLSAGSALTNCLFHHNGKAGLGFAARNATVSRCAFTHNAGKVALWTLPATPAAFDHGLYMVGQVPNFDRAQNNLVQDCLFDNNVKAGFSTDALSGDHIVVRCIATNNTLFGFFLEGGTTNSSSGTALYHCTAWNNQKSGLHVLNNYGPFTAKNCNWFLNGRDGSQDVYIEWNISTFTLFSGVSGTNAVYIKQHHEWDPVALSQDDQTVLTPVADVATVQITAGSWFYDSAAATIYVRKTTSTAPTTCWGNPTYVLDYNNYTPDAQRAVGQAIYRKTSAGTTNAFYTVLSALQAGQAGIEVHGLQVDPLYVDAANGNFTLGASVCVDGGLAIAGVNDFYKGAAPDIGAAPDTLARFAPAGRRPPSMEHPGNLFSRMRQANAALMAGSAYKAPSAPVVTGGFGQRRKHRYLWVGGYMTTRVGH